MAAKAKGKLLDACRAALRIPAFVTDYDEEISDVIEAARAELVAGGVADAKAHDDSDGRVRLAIKVYVKANFGMDNPDAERFMKAFETMLTSMSGDSAYNGGDAAWAGGLAFARLSLPSQSAMIWAYRTKRSVAAVFPATCTASARRRTTPPLRQE